jgi:hypothetical protein
VAPNWRQTIGLDCAGNSSNSTPTTQNSFTSPDGNAWRITRQFGTTGDWAAQEGEQLLLITTGKLPAIGANNVQTENDVDDFNGSSISGNANPDNVGTLPGGIVPVDDPPPCDGTNDCSESLQAQWEAGDSAANDLLWFEFTVNTPGGTNGWAMDFSFFSSEFPEYVNSGVNDIFTVWVDSPEFTGNTCFVGDSPCSVDALIGAANTFTGAGNTNHPSLAGTDYGGGSGQVTGWQTLTGPATPGQPLRIAFAIFDMGDDIFDTAVVMDDWRWDCTGCIPGLPVEDGGCGVEPQ